jgi:hypothetical protein
MNAQRRREAGVQVRRTWSNRRDVRLGSWSCQNALAEAAQAGGYAPPRSPLRRRLGG